MAEQEKRERTTQSRNRNNAARIAKRKKIIRRRRITLAAIIAVLVAIIVLIVCFATGVLGSIADTSKMTLKDDGQIVYEEVSSFDQDYYSKSELKSYIKDTIKEYNDKADKDSTVKFKKLKVKKEKAYAKYIFSDYKTYSDFTGETIYSGTVAKASKAGYDFSDTFYKVKDGAKSEEATSKEILKKTKYKVLIVRGNMNVKVPGTIVYVSDSCTTMVDDDEISIAQEDGNEDATVLTYIIYK